MPALPKMTSELIKMNVDHETLVLDSEQQLCFLLSEPAGRILELCDGVTERHDVELELGTQPVAEALEQLKNAGLLMQGMGRRDVFKRGGLIAAGTLVTVIGLPAAAAAASGNVPSPGTGPVSTTPPAAPAPSTSPAAAPTSATSPAVARTVPVRVEAASSTRTPSTKKGPALNVRALANTRQVGAPKLTPPGGTLAYTGADISGPVKLGLTLTTLGAAAVVASQAVKSPQSADPSVADEA